MQRPQPARNARPCGLSLGCFAKALDPRKVWHAMPRPNKIWFRKDIGYWMVPMAGKMVRLAEGR